VASVVTTRLPPESYMLLAVYSGDSAHLPASTGSYSGYLSQQVHAQSTSVSLTSSPAGARPGAAVAFTAIVTPGVRGPVSPTGEVEFINHSDGDLIAEAPVTTSGATSKSVVKVLATGVTSVVATYTGDYDYAGSSSSPLTLRQSP
jgi:large repetitive protein